LNVHDEVTYRIRHVTSYAYSDLVTLAHNEARLSPRNGPFQVAHHARLVVDPTPAFLTREHDYFGNAVNLFVLQEPHRRFSVTAHSVRWNGAIVEYAAESFTRGRPLLAAAIDLSRRIHEDFDYRAGVTTTATPVATVFEQRNGVCQDFAHLMIACMRSHGLATRYVSGYLLTHPAAGHPRRVGADASHAWASVYCPEYDFIDIDPTNDLVVTIEHPTLAWGRDFGDVSPLKGVVLGGGAHRVEVSVEVMPVDDDSA
jgi:transglutaminase-like putative cysteine protease